MFVISLLKISSILLSIVGVLFAIPLGVAFYYGESQVYLSFIIPMAVSFVFVAAVNFPTRHRKITMNTRQTFLIVALSWVVVSLMGAIPLYASGSIPRFVDALFESVSGFSTTGSTILSEIETLPKSINMLRCLTHWIGGMGIVTLTVALLPLLGVGGFQLIKAETTGPEKGKVTARITTTAKILWLIYLGFTVAETIALKIAGMTFSDALSHAFATLGTGGFSTRNTSIGAYNSVAIDVIIMIFMFLSGINFSLYFYIITRKFSDIGTNSEFKAYLIIIFALIAAVTVSLIGYYGSFGSSLRYSSFQVISLMTTTGFSTADFMDWPAVTQFLLFVTFFIGGCSGSTSGGVKVIRWLVLGKQVQNETRKMLHPHGVFAIRLNGRPGRKDIVFNVAAFMVVYFGLVAITTFVGCLGKLDVWSAFTGALSMVGNIGPGYAMLGPSQNFGFLPDFVKYWYSFAMLAGRLELYTMIIFFLPVYWEK
ncbi:trk system potassium uptake protein TrkH [Treponema bryantii]|uniref:Trk system potassium uptake protein TrkH n=1 Tax=Treponema bryantii TaxID=163 RepID=A0A1I3HUG0_9SPIR|nr:potassium transporter TrkG [Treponema bryantii]SFI39180.1 trk system potassium uptake protein TrkH [Treponema bryantii]